MKKLFVYMLVGAGVFASAAYADGYNPFHPLGGINSATTVPQVYSDGSTGTLAQIGQMADGSVQQTDANQPNGYPKLDANKTVTVPVTGSVAAAPANASGDTVSSIADTAKAAQTTANGAVQTNGGDATKTVVTRSRSATLGTLVPKYADLFADMSQMPYNGIGTGSPLYTVYSAANNGDTIHVNSVGFPYPNNGTFPHTPNKSVLFDFHGQANYGPNGNGSAPGTFLSSHSLMRGYWNNRINLTKYIGLEHNSDGSVIDPTVTDSSPDYNPLMQIRYQIDDQYPQTDCPEWCGRMDVPGLVVSATEGSGSAASTVPITAALDTYGHGGFYANSVALKSYVNNYGNNSTWGIDTRNTDLSGRQPMNDGVSGGGYNTVAIENDIQVNGQDNPNIEFNAFGYRLFQHLGAGFAGTGEASYGENVCAYSVGNLVQMPEYNADGSPVLDPWGKQLSGIFRVASITTPCSGSMGKTGSIPATAWVRGAGATKMWQKGTDGTYSAVASSIPAITSGDVVFNWGEDVNATVGNGVRVIGSNDTTELQNGKTAVQLGSYFYGSGYALNSGMDLSGIHCGINIEDMVKGVQSTVPWTQCQAIRIAPDMGIDLTASTAVVSNTPAQAKSSMNNHVIKYASADTAFEYLVFGKNMYSIGDTGLVTTPNYTDVKPSSPTFRRDFMSGSYADALGQWRQYAGSWKWVDIPNNRSASLPISGTYGVLGVDPTTGYTQFFETLSSTEASFAEPIALHPMAKSDILALTGMSEGWKVFNTDDHVEETYRCPSTTTCGWYAPQYEASPLSN